MYDYKYVGSPNHIETESGYFIATGFNRVVLGERGAYVEFLDSQIRKDVLHVPSDQEWRAQGPSSIYAHYIWYETPEGEKVYHQKKRVSYADYVPGRWYMSPIHLKDFIRKE